MSTKYIHELLQNVKNNTCSLKGQTTATASYQKPWNITVQDSDLKMIGKVFYFLRLIAHQVPFTS